MKVGSLFTGIGGLDLALEAFGHDVIWQAESNAYARRVLARHWPTVTCFEDVKEIDETAERPDIICGGFPCQDISNAGKRVGIDGERSGLWSEFARIIRVLRPSVVFVENVAALTVRGLDRVLGDLASLGFDAEWDVLRAADVGAPHLRARIFILAYAQCDAVRLEHRRLVRTHGTGEAEPRRDGQQEHVADAECPTCDEWSEVARIRGGEEGEDGSGLHESGGRGEDVSDADVRRRTGVRRTEREQPTGWIEDAPGNVADGRGGAPLGSPNGQGRAWVVTRGWRAGSDALGAAGWWDAEPDVGRVVARLPSGVDGRGTGIGPGSRGIGGGRDRANRLRCLGNAVVWQQAALAWETLIARSARPSSTVAA